MYADALSANALFFEVITNICIISVLTLYLAYIWQNSKKTEMLSYYSVMHLIAILALVSNFLVRIAPTGQIRWASIAISSVINSCFSISFFYYGHYFNTRKHLSIKAAILVLTFPISSLIIVLTNSYHLLFVDAFTVSAINYGVMYYVLSAAGYGFQFSGAVYMIAFLLGKGKPSLYRALIVTIILLSFTLQFLFVSNVLYSPIDMNPILILLIFTFLFFGAYRLGLLNTLSIGVIRSLQMFSDALLVLDENRHAVFKNEACLMLGEDTINHVMTQCKNASHEFLDQSPKKYVKEMETTYKDKTLSISIRTVKTILKKTAGYVCTIHDDTSIIGLIKDLKEKNEQLAQMNESIKVLAADIKRLAIIEERNILAKEIHDVLGHSLNLTFHTLESNKVIIDEQPERAIQRLKQVITDIDRGIGDVEVASLGVEISQHNSFSTLYKHLKVMSDRLKDIGVYVELATADDLSGCDSKILQTIYRICQEASTNSIKHGNSSQVVISIKREDKAVILHIIDNGTGCKTFVRGNGLNGMEDRIKKVGGSINFGPFDDDNGFLVHAVIPVD